MAVPIVAGILLAAVAYALAWGGTRLLNALGEQSARRRFLKRLGPLWQALVWGAAILFFVLAVVHPSRAALWTALTASGVVIGFAAQDLLKSLAGGFIIVIDRPFQVGDKVRAGDNYGEVVSIGLRSTRLQTPDDSMVTMPNADMVGHPVSNANSGALDCQVITTIVLPDTVDIAQARQLGWEAAMTSRYIHLAKPVSVVVEDAPSEKRLRTRLKIKAYVLDHRLEFAFSSDILEALKTALRASIPPSP